MPKTKRQSRPEAVEMMSLTSFPRSADFRAVEKAAFDLWMLYRSLDMRVHQLAELTLKREKHFIHAYKTTHLGQLPDRDDFKPEVARLASMHIDYLAEVHGGVDRAELYASAGLSGPG